MDITNLILFFETFKIAARKRVYGMMSKIAR